jgi:hypothetical protein
MKAVLKFKFPEGTEKQFIEASMASAIFNAECVFGKPRVRVSCVAYYIADDSRQCVIDVSSEVGEHVAQVFTGIMMNVLGEEKFLVTRIEGEAASAKASSPS